MANIPCPNSIICPGNDDPFANFSSEAPDPLVFRRFGYPIVNPNNPIGGPGGGPHMPPVYYAGDCAGVCVSTLSQEDADLCAARQSYICSHTPPGGPPPTLFHNAPVICGVPCGGGSTFFWFVPAGAFVGTSQAQVDEQASAYACDQAARHAFCLNDIDNEAETGTEYDQTIFIQSGPARPPVTFAVLSGQLPPGLVLTPEGPISTFLHGKPTQSGTFNFTIIATDAMGIFVTKNYTITVTSTCSKFWSDLFPFWGFTTFFAASSASVVGNVVSVSAYVRHALDASALAEATALLPSPETDGFQCQMTVTPVAQFNLLNPGHGLQILVQDQITAAIYLQTGAISPAGVTVFTFTLPPGAKPLVDIQVACTNAGNAIDSQEAYTVLLG